MPLVRIGLLNGQATGRPADFGRRVGEAVYRTMVETIGVPAQDHFQVITEHDRDSLVFDRGYLGIERSNGYVLVQITLNEGRSIEQKKALYRTLADRLHAELGVRREDVMISLVEVKKENWSFGNGLAQYAL
jgi:phenylpyruvate tautomerase PptA (4-oxalocrotonate tautomerase family)